MSYITTYTGKHFDPVNPEIELIDIKDIAHALSLICRGNGQVKSFFSVGQHCINAAKEAKLRGYSNRVILACLIHDAGESYLSDVPRPLKPSMPEYVRTEEHLLDFIYEKYLGNKLNEEEQALVKSIDKRAGRSRPAGGAEQHRRLPDDEGDRAASEALFEPESLAYDRPFHLGPDESAPETVCGRPGRVRQAGRAGLSLL